MVLHGIDMVFTWPWYDVGIGRYGFLLHGRDMVFLWY